jgi:hypothetical protein
MRTRGGAVESARSAISITVHVPAVESDVRARELWLGIGRCVTEGCGELTTGAWCVQCEAEGRAGRAERPVRLASRRPELPLRWSWLAAAGIGAGMYAVVMVTWWEWVKPWIRRWGW